MAWRPPAARRKAGKADEGTVRIAVRREGSEVVLQGQRRRPRPGSRTRSARKAIERGLIKPDAMLSDGDLVRPDPRDRASPPPKPSAAWPAAASAWTWSHSEIRQLGGSLDIASTPGKGSDLHPAPAVHAGGHPGGVRQDRRHPASRCRSPRCRAWVASPATSSKQLAGCASLPLRRRGLRAPRPRRPDRHTHRPRPKGSLQMPLLLVALRRPARGGRRSTRCSAAAKSWSSRSARS